MASNPTDMADGTARARAVPSSEDSLYRKVCESMTSGVMLVDAKGRVETFNRAAAAILGLDRDAVLKRGFAEAFLTEERFEELNDALLAAIHDGEVGHRGVATVTVGERRVPLSVSTAYLRESTHAGTARRGVVALFSDITEVEELRIEEFRLKRDLEAQNKELSEAYLRLEDRNRELGTLGRKVRAVRVAASVIVVALAVAGGAYFWSGTPEDWFGATAASDAADSGDPHFVAVERRPISTTITVASVIKPRREVAVTSPIQGQIDRVHVRHGEAVAAGQPLLTLDLGEERIQQRSAQTAWLKARMAMDELANWNEGIEAAKARRAVNKARISLEANRAELEETAFLVENGLIPSKRKTALERDRRTRRLDLEAAEQELAAVLARGREDLQVARLELASAKEELERIDRVLRNATVPAPVAGVVLRVERRGLRNSGPLSAGSPVEQGQKLFTIGDIEGVAVTGWVDEADIWRIGTGYPVRISGPAFPDMELEGRVTYVSSEAARRTGRKLPAFEVAAEVDRLDGEQRKAVRLGMSADMKILVYENEAALVVPVEAVDLSAGRPRLHVWDDASGTARATHVDTGTTTADAVEILSGVSHGDRVVLP